MNLSTGTRTILSDASTGGGPVFSFPLGVALDAANKPALVIDFNLDALFAVDLENGERVIISR